MDAENYIPFTQIHNQEGLQGTVIFSLLVMKIQWETFLWSQATSLIPVLVETILEISI